jgi:hypothetical protein
MPGSATGGRYEGCGSVVATVAKRVESERTTEYDGGAPDEGGAESADGRRPQNLI